MLTQTPLRPARGVLAKAAAPMLPRAEAVDTEFAVTNYERTMDSVDVARSERVGALRVASGWWSPPCRELTDDERHEVAARINPTGGAVVWVGTGQPKHEKWTAPIRKRLEAPILAGVGAAFDFHAGIVPQPPSCMQRGGLECAYRLAREPRRLGRRYDPRFVVREYAAGRAGR